MRSNPGGSFAGTGARTVKFSNIAGGHPGAGNINTAAHFVNHSTGSFRLKPNSPCIDAGKTGLFTYSVPIDLDGNPRFVDAPSTPNTGQGNPPIDMGAYEFQP